MRYVCSICGYVYDDAEQKVPFAELPSDWTCPMCGAAKSDFAPQEEAPSVKKTVEAASESAHEFSGGRDSDMTRLSAGQMAALCSNLARGCEKQYKAEESALFTRLAEYFDSLAPAVDDATVNSVAERLREEIGGYAALKATAEAAGDRGAQRVCVWGEKVTRMLSTLVERYLKDGEKMLEGTEVWVCSVCGFVYIGQNAPELCPVCKVPSWKFEKM